MNGCYRFVVRGDYPLELRFEQTPQVDDIVHGKGDYLCKISNEVSEELSCVPDCETNVYVYQKHLMDSIWERVSRATKGNMFLIDYVKGTETPVDISKECLMAAAFDAEGYDGNWYLSLCNRAANFMRQGTWHVGFVQKGGTVNEVESKSPWQGIPCLWFGLDGMPPKGAWQITINDKDIACRWEKETCDSVWFNAICDVGCLDTWIFFESDCGYGPQIEFERIVQECPVNLSMSDDMIHAGITQLIHKLQESLQG